MAYVRRAIVCVFVCCGACGPPTARLPGAVASPEVHSDGGQLFASPADDPPAWGPDAALPSAKLDQGTAALPPDGAPPDGITGVTVDAAVNERLDALGIDQIDARLTFDGGLPLPMAVTEQYNNFGWFGDPSLAAFFTPGSNVIRQAASTTGPCASRPAGARGACMQIIYTPPPALQPPPTGGWGGSFWLTTLAASHPEAVPPARAGDPNWGAEPGPRVAAGATRISFFAASDTPGTIVAFKAGTAADSFALGEQSQTLGTAWQKFELPLQGQSYGAGVLGPLAWLTKNTRQPLSFYLDNIVWE